MARASNKKVYNPQMTPLLVKWMVRAGMTNAEVAKELGIKERSLYRWQRQYPQLAAAMSQSRNFVDHLAEDALLRRALGFSVEEHHVEQAGDKVKTRTIKKQLAPDVVACIFWLKNRRPDLWRDHQDLHVNGPLPGDAKLRESLLADPEIGRLTDELQQRMGEIGGVGAAAVDAHSGADGAAPDAGPIPDPEARGSDQPGDAAGSVEAGCADHPDGSTTPR